MSQPGDGPWFAPEKRMFGTPSNHTLSGRRPRVAFIVAPPCRADRSCRHAGLGAVGGGDGDRAPIDRRPPLRVWERRITGDARGTPPRIESSKDSDFLIGGAPFRAQSATAERADRSPSLLGSWPWPTNREPRCAEAPRCQAWFLVYPSATTVAVFTPETKNKV